MGRLLKPVLLLAALGAAAGGVAWLAGGRPDPLTAARAALDRRDFAAAVRDLDAHLARHPRDRAALLLAAQAARRGGDGPAGEAYLVRYLEAGGDPEQAELERLLRTSQEGKVDNAPRVLAFCKANPDHPSVHLMLEALARGLLTAGPPHLAVQCLDLWLSRPLAPADRVQALVWRAQALERQGLAPEAAEDYRQALAADPDHGEARLRLAKFLVRDQPAEALDHFRRLDRESPGRPDVVLGMAQSHHQLGELDAAAELLGRLNPDRSADPDVVLAAGTLALDRGRPKEAEALLRRAVALAPRRRDPNVQLLRCLRELGDEKAVRAQEAVVKEIDEEIQRRIAAAGGKP